MPGTVESSAKGIFLMANWREVLLCRSGAEKGFLFTLRMLQIFLPGENKG